MLIFGGVFGEFRKTSGLTVRSSKVKLPKNESSLVTIHSKGLCWTLEVYAIENGHDFVNLPVLEGWK